MVGTLCLRVDGAKDLRRQAKAADLGSYAELAEVYKRAFQLMAVLHGDRMFGETKQALFWVG